MEAARVLQGSARCLFGRISSIRDRRIIWLARLGFGAGWIDEGTSWQYVVAAKAALQRAYASWSELRAGIDEGRAEWYGGPAKVPAAQVTGAERSFQYASRNFLGAVPFRDGV